MARFLQLTDLHAVRAGTLCSGVLDTRAQLSRAIDRLIEMRAAHDPLDAVLVTGDISDDGSAESYAFARSELNRLGLPLFVVPGNHDARAPMRAAFADLPHMPQDGLIDWTAEVGDTLLIGLDTLIEGQGGGALRPESLSLLADALGRAGERAVVVMLHHPPLTTGIRFMDAIGLENSSALEEALAGASGQVTVIAGHVHGVHIGHLADHTVYTAPSTCSSFALDRRADAPVGFHPGPTGCAILDTGPDGIWSAIPLDPVARISPF